MTQVQVYTAYTGVSTTQLETNYTAFDIITQVETKYIYNLFNKQCITNKMKYETIYKI